MEVNSGNHLNCRHYRKSSKMQSIFIPNESVPSLIGVKGEKIKDIELKTGCKITMFKNPVGLAEVVIKNGDTKKAAKIILLAVKHFIAATSPLPQVSSNIADRETAKADMRCFYAETRNHSTHIS